MGVVIPRSQRNGFAVCVVGCGAAVQLRRETAVGICARRIDTAAYPFRGRLPVPGAAVAMVTMAVALGMMAFKGERGAVHGRGEGGRHGDTALIDQTRQMRTVR